MATQDMTTQGNSSSVYPVPAVGALVIDGGKVLLVRRKNPPARGEWSVPGGRVLPGETLQTAAEREVYEETGLNVRAGDPVFAFDLIERERDNSLRFHYVIVDLLAEYVDGIPAPGDDAEEAQWVGPEELNGSIGRELNRMTRELLCTVPEFCDVLSVEP